MNTYKLQEEELLASFRPDISQNRQLQPQNIPQSVSYPPQQQLQGYPSNQSNQAPSNLQSPSVAFPPQDPSRISPLVAQGEQQVPQSRGNSPPIMISYNEMQRGISPQQGSIVTQVYKPIPQQAPVYESKPQSNINQPYYPPSPAFQQPQMLPQQAIPQQQHLQQQQFVQQQAVQQQRNTVQPQQQVINQQQIPQPQPIPQQQAPPQQVLVPQQQISQSGQQIAMLPNHTVVSQHYHNPQAVPQQITGPVQHYVNQHGQIQYIQTQNYPQPHQGYPPVHPLPAGQYPPPPPGYHYQQQQTHHIPPQYQQGQGQPVPQPIPQQYQQISNQPRPFSESAPEQQPPKQPLPPTQAQGQALPPSQQPQQIQQGQQVPQAQGGQQIQGGQNPPPPPRAHTASQHQQYLQYQQQQQQQQYHQQQLYMQGQQQQYAEGQQYPPQEYPPQYYQQGYYPQGQEGAQYEQYPPEYYQQQGYDQYPPEYYQQQQEYPPEYYEQQQGQSTLWQQRFFFLYEKYNIFLEKFEGVTKEGGYLTQQFMTVDNEEDWVALKEKYDLLVQRMGEARDENYQILQEMQENIQQNQKVENSNDIKEEAGRVWEHRYHKLLEEYESLSHHYAELQSSSMAHNDMDESERLAMMNEKYARLEAEYSHVVQQLQNSPNSMQSRQEHEDLLKYTQQLQGYIQQLENENNTLMKGMKTSVEGSKMLDQAELSQKVADKESEIQNLTQMVVSLEEKLKQGEPRPKSNISKDLHTSQLENQLQEMNHYCAEIEQKLSMKEYEINGLKDKNGYLEEQLHIKSEEVANNGRLLQEKLQRIETELASKSSQNIPLPAPVQYARIEEDYQARIKDYQKAIQTKNGEIRVLQDRVYECESEARKLNFEKTAHLREWQERLDQLEDDFRKKVAERDGRIRQLEATCGEREEEGQRRAQEKDSTVKAFEAELARLKQDTEGRLVERDLLIKGLKEAAGRLEGEIRDRNSELSRIRSPNLTPMMRSPNQSFVVENIRYEEELKLLADQLDRRNEEVGKLKKEREQRLKQYRDLEIEYENLQEESNKRRMELNSLRRQNTTIENLELETENLRTTITKRNSEINELKNALFEADRLRMDLDNRAREVDKLTEISRMKAKEIEQLSERNYELEEKLRQRDFKLNAAFPARNDPPATRGAQQEVLRLQEELRKKEIDLGRFRLESEELARSLKREKDELEALKQKYPPRLRQAEEELAEIRLKLASLEKKATALETKNRELEELTRSLRNASAEESRTETARLKEYYGKFIERQQEQIRQLKERSRGYELRLHEYEQEVDQLSARTRETEAFRGDHARRLKALADKLEAKEEELRSFRARENAELLQLRKKEQRLVETQAVAKSREGQIREMQRREQAAKASLKALRKEFDDYKHSAIERMEVSTHKEMENLSKQIADYESKVVLQTHNFEFRTRDKKANQIFERRVIYELKEENEFLRRELEGKGVNISLEKLKINQMQQEALMKSKHLIARDDHSHAEELAFYKDKNKELEERVNSHIAVNKNLRERLEYLLEEGKYEESDKLKLRLIELENKEKEYQEKLQRLLDENKNIRRENNTLNISSSNSQDYEIQLQDLNRKLAQATLERNATQQELAVVRAERQNLQGQCRELQKQLTKLSGQNGLLKSEIDRLKESKNSNSDGKNANEQLQRQVAQLSLDLANRTDQLQRVSAEFDALQHHIHGLELELAATKQQLLSSSDSYSEIEHWKRTASDLQAALVHMRDQLEHLEQECQYYKAQGGQGTPAVREEAFYYIELLRNNSVEVESLASEVGLESERMALLVERLSENSRRSLESCQYLHEILS